MWFILYTRYRVSNFACCRGKTLHKINRLENNMTFKKQNKHLLINMTAYPGVAYAMILFINLLLLDTHCLFFFLAFCRSLLTQLLALLPNYEYLHN